MTSKVRHREEEPGMSLLDILVLVLKKELPGPQQDSLIDYLKNREEQWASTDRRTFNDKVEELIAEWKAQNIK